MFRALYTQNTIQKLDEKLFETEAAAETFARALLDEDETVTAVVILRPIAEFTVVKTVSMKEWKQMLKDQADA